MHFEGIILSSADSAEASGGAEVPRFPGCRVMAVQGLSGLEVKAASRTVALRAEDEAMGGRRIVSGDVVVLEHGWALRPGEGVAALADNESVVREYRVENGRSFLRDGVSGAGAGDAAGGGAVGPRVSGRCSL